MFVPAANNIVTLHVEFGTKFSGNMYVMISYISIFDKNDYNFASLHGWVTVINLCAIYCCKTKSIAEPVFIYSSITL